jgi:hypothetical protein
VKKLRTTKSKKTEKRLVPKTSQILKTSWLDISTFWRMIAGVLAVYAVLNFIFVVSISILPTNEVLEAEITTYLGASAGRIIDSFTLVGISLLNISSPSNTVLQVVLFIIASMALIWTIRKLRGLQKITIRQAYYEGPANIIPLVLVVVMLLCTLIPASLASTLLVYALPVVGTAVEFSVLYAIAGALVLLTIYWTLVWWPAFYISMLPGTKPIAAMRAAAALTKKRRLKIWGRIVLLGLLLVSLFFIVVLPISIIYQRIVPLFVYITVTVLFGLGHILFFNLYRSLIDESDPAKQSKKA